ncbi:MAG: DUF4145 domain-containing protein [Bacteroidales bacterium]|nr:DUF4145 domain-containing protein [Bacteroidales bacterium]
MVWIDAKNGETHNYVCGYCGSDITSQFGYYAMDDNRSGQIAYIRICHRCGKPTFISNDGKTVPSAIYGKNIEHLPKEIEELYNEARRCFNIDAYTSVIMCCRKLLMHIACENGAEKDLAFGRYVQYLKDKGYVATPTHKLADAILTYGNIANHQLEIYTKKDATNIMLFTEAILKNIYELPSIYDELAEEKE